jgi:DNA mismatch endonuclease, patch repair protein
VDQLSKEDRSKLMKRVRRSHTAPELKLRKALHRQGLRYVIGDRRLPGSPDIVFPKHHIALFVHGCFWHGHDCRQGRAPGSNQDYWLPKMEANKCRDAKKHRQLEELGWRVITVWECELKHLEGAALEDFAARVKARISKQ